MDKTELKKIFKDRFKLYFKGCKLAAVQLNGFTHKIFYINENGRRDRLIFSGCVSPEEARCYGWNDARCALLFDGFPNYQYQNNAVELVFMQPATFAKYGG